MDTMNRLSSSLQDRRHKRKGDAEIQKQFRQSAIALTQLLKTAQASVQQSYEFGYADALQDMLEVVLQTGLDGNHSGISSLLDWIEARQETLRGDASDAEELSDEQPVPRQRAPTPNRTQSPPSVIPPPQHGPEASTSMTQIPTPVTAPQHANRFNFTCPSLNPPADNGPVLALTPANSATLEQRKRASPRGKRRFRDVSAAALPSTSAALGTSTGDCHRTTGLKRKHWWDDAATTSEPIDIVLDSSEAQDEQRIFNNFGDRSDPHTSSPVDERPHKRVR